MFRTRASAYGWAFYFGDIGEAVEPGFWSNVCVGCGAGHPASGLIESNLVRPTGSSFKAIFVQRAARGTCSRPINERLHPKIVVTEIISRPAAA